MFKLPFKFGSKKGPPQFLTVDIGSDFVKCLSFEVTEMGDPAADIVGVGKAQMNPGSTRGGNIVDEDDVSEALEKAVSEAVGGSGGFISAPEDAIFGVSGDLSLGLMTTVRMTRGSNSPISQKELDEIFEKIREAAYNQAQSEIMDITGNPELEVELITSSIVYTQLDGKSVDELAGAEGRKLEIALFTAFTPTYHTHLLQKLSGRVGLNIYAIAPQMYSLVRSLEFSEGKNFDGVVMDIGGDLTDVGVVFGGGIVSTRSLPIGGSHFTRELAENMGLSYFDAEKVKTAYSLGKLSESESLIVQNNVDEVLEIWLSGIELLFMDFTGVKTFASDFYLVGGGTVLPDINECISKEPWTRSIPFKSPPEFKEITLENLPRIQDKTGRANNMEFILPAAMSVVYLESEGYL